MLPAVASLALCPSARADAPRSLRALFFEPAQLAGWLAAQDAPTEAARSRRDAAREGGRQTAMFGALGNGARRKAYGPRRLMRDRRELQTWQRS